MKFGVDAPWYQDSVERVAFNLYAMDCERLNAIAREIMETYAGDIVDLDDLKPVYGLNDREVEYIYKYIDERC